MAIVAKNTKKHDGKIARPDVRSGSVVTEKTRSRVKSKSLGTATDPAKLDILTLTNLTQADEYGQIFNLATNPALLSQYIRVYSSNQRKGNAKTKNRGEVAGSGKKPWKQKGTGRSRVGSIRTPVWRHGGVSHGPVLKDWTLNFPKKMKSKVLLIALSQKFESHQLYLVDKLELAEGRTKAFVDLLTSWKLKGKTLVITDVINPHALSASANLKNVTTITWTDLNSYQVLSHADVVFEKSALNQIKEKYVKSY